MNRTLLPFSAPVVALLLSGCSNNDRAELSAEKRLPSSQRPTVFGATPEERFGMGRQEAGLVAETPKGWTQLASKQFRDLNWQVGEATECFLTQGSAGSLEQNVDRWLGQLGLTSGAVKPGPAEHQLMGMQASLLEAEGTFNGKASYMMLVLLAQGEKGLTTLKMTGPKEVVQREKDAFLQVAKTIKAGRSGGDHGATPPEAVGPAPGGGGKTDPHAGLDMGVNVAASTGSGDPKAEKVPADWRVVPPTGGMRKLDYRFGTGSECYIVTMSGHAGGIRPNVDRWRNETGMQPISDAEFAALVKKPVLGVQATIMEARGKFSSAMSGRTIPEALVLGAIVPLKAETLFVKMIGPAAEIEAQRGAFADFCSGLKL